MTFLAFFDLPTVSFAKIWRVFTTFFIGREYPMHYHVVLMTLRYPCVVAFGIGYIFHFAML